MEVVEPATTHTCSLLDVQERSGERIRWRLQAGANTYQALKLDWNDITRQTAYGRLRGEVFVHQLGWDLALDPDGAERDRYDIAGGCAIASYGVAGLTSTGVEHLLGGLRVFTLRSWDDSMLMHEFSRAGMIPSTVRAYLQKYYTPRQLIELTRLCVHPGRWYPSPSAPPSLHATTEASFDLMLVRDLVYGCAYAAAEAAGRRYALAIADTPYLRVMRRSHFVFDLLYQVRTSSPTRRHGYAVVIIDLPATIHAIRSAGDSLRARRMLLLCHNPHWVTLWKEEKSHG